MTTIDQLATQLSDLHGVDPTVMARSIRALVDQIADDPDLWDGQLTPDGVDLVTTQVSETYAAGTIATEASQLLEQIAAAESRRGGAARQADEHAGLRDELIRAALRTEARRGDIAAAGGVSVGRLYQIRDGRR